MPALRPGTTSSETWANAPRGLGFLSCSTVARMTSPRHDLHESLYTEIDSRLQSLKSGAPAGSSDGGAWTQDEVDAQIRRLETDLDVLLQHWRIKDGVVVADAPPRARACGQSQPCPHVLQLAQEYRIF